ncbi:MAG: protein jag [Faecalibacterium prausnitzii]
MANRLEGDYIKLGLDVAGYRDKRESDLTALAQRIGAKVRQTGRSFAMEPMNPYERRIIHSAIGKMEGVRSESKGEGRDRRVVIYSTDTRRCGLRAPMREPRDRRGGRMAVVTAAAATAVIIAAASAAVTGMAAARAMAAARGARTAPVCLSAPTPRATPRMLHPWHPSAPSAWMTSADFSFGKIEL